MQLPLVWIIAFGSLVLPPIAVGAWKDILALTNQSSKGDNVRQLPLATPVSDSPPATHHEYDDHLEHVISCMHPSKPKCH